MRDPMDSAGVTMWWFLWIVLVVSAICVMSCCGCSHVTGPPADAYQAEADAVVALAFAADPVDPNTPDPAPDDGDDDQPKPGDTCPQCDGSGRSGDGLGRCRKCGGDGKIDERDIRANGVNVVRRGTPPKIARQKFGTVTLHITDQNKAGWPMEWWRETRPKIESRWDVHVVKDVDPKAKRAWFDVCTSERCYRVRTVTPENLQKLERRIK